MKPSIGNLINIYSALVLLTVGYVTVALYLGLVLEYEFMRSDVLWYWEDSLDWQRPFNRFHVPGFPLTIALLSSISFGKLPPVLLMMGINITALLVSAWTVFQVIKNSGARDEFALMGAFLFGLWPFVGLAYAVYPLADVPAMALFLAGLLALQHTRLRIAALLLGLSMIFHKAMWPFVAFIVIADLCHNKYRLLQDFIALTILLLPISTLWLFGAFYHGSLAWMFSSSLAVGVETRGALPVLEGVTGTIRQGGLKGLMKGGLIVAFVFTSVVLLLLNLRSKPPNFQYGIAISLACLFLFIFLTHLEIWGAVRFRQFPR